MPIDPRISLGVQPIQLADPVAQYSQLSAIQNAQNQNALTQYQIAKAKREDVASEAMNELYSKHYNTQTGKVNENALFQDLADRNLGSKIPDVQSKLLEAQSKAATLAETKQKTDTGSFKLKIDKANKAISDIAALNSPDEAIASIDQHVKNGDIDQQKADMLKGQLTQAPSFGAWQKSMLTNILDAKEKLTLTAPKPTEVNLNNKKIFIDLNPNSPTFQQEVAPEQKVGMTPYESAMLPIHQGQLGVSRAGLGIRAAEVDPFGLSGVRDKFPVGMGTGNALAPAAPAAAPANALATQPVVQRTPKSAPAAGQTLGGAKMSLADAVSSGVTGNDLLAYMPKSLAAQVTAITDHRAAPPERNTNRGSQITQLVQMVDPTYDATSYKTKQGTETAFTSGRLGTTARSFNVVNEHLDTLGKLSDALQNNDTQLINKVGNFVSAQTGSAAPTNFDAAKRIVADEVVKAVIGGAGALGDRKTAEDALSGAKSPEQLKGVIKTYQDLINGQLNGFRQQYKSGGGAKDFDKDILGRTPTATPAAAGKVDTSNKWLK